MKGKARKESKRAPRLLEAHPLVITRLSDGYEALVRTTDISLGGLSFINDLPIEVGSKLGMLVSLEGRVFTANGTVKSEKYSIDEDEWRIGVRFFKLSPRAKRMISSILELEGLSNHNPESGRQVA